MAAFTALVTCLAVALCALLVLMVWDILCVERKPIRPSARRIGLINREHWE